MDKRKKLSLKIAGIVAGAVSAITATTELSNAEAVNLENLNISEFKSISKVKPVGVFKLNTSNPENSKFVAQHRSHSSHRSHYSRRN